MRHRQRFTFAAALVALFLILPDAAAAKNRRVVVKLGTLAPKGSAWEVILKEMAQDWRRASDNQVIVKIFAGGTAGDEPEMLRRMRIGQLHAASLTVAGLAFGVPATQGLSTPMMFRSYEELDYVRERVTEDLERRLVAKGYVLMNWGDAGWVRYFATQPIRTPDDMRQLKLFTWTGDQKALEIWKDFGFKPVPLAATDILPSLQTGLIEVTPMTAASALAGQMFTVAKHMLDLRWSPLPGVTLVTEKTWLRIPAKYHEELRAIAAASGAKMRQRIRGFDAESIATMKGKGLQVQVVDEELRAEWEKLAQTAYPRIRTDFVGAEFFDRLMELRDEYRAANPGKLSASASP